MTPSTDASPFFTSPTIIFIDFFFIFYIWEQLPFHSWLGEIFAYLPLVTIMCIYLGFYVEIVF